MTAITTSTITSAVPGMGGKCLLIKTPATAVGSDTIDVSATKPALKTIYYVSPTVGSTGAGASSTWSSTTITLAATFGTAGAAAYLVVWGTD